MKISRIACLLIALTFLLHTRLFSQPAPVELMMGNKYGTVNFVFGKIFSETSKFGFFHMNTIQFGMQNKAFNNFIMQDLLFVEAVKNIRITGGAIYSPGGFDPTAGFQYLFTGKKLFILCAPRINIEDDPTYDIMTIVQYKPLISSKIKLYTRLQMLNLFNSSGNMKSCQWLRLGLDIKELQFGLAGNLDEIGHSPSIEASFGLFFRKEIF